MTCLKFSNFFYSGKSSSYFTEEIAIFVKKLCSQPSAQSYLDAQQSAYKTILYRQAELSAIRGKADYEEYLMIGLDNIEIHFFEFKELDPTLNYGQVYIRVSEIDQLYQSMLDKELAIHPAGHLQTKPWQQKEFSMLDPDNNLLTFTNQYNLYSLTTHP